MALKIVVEIPDDDCLTCPMCHAARMAYGNLYCELMSKREVLVEKDGKHQRTETCENSAYETHQKSKHLNETGVEVEGRCFLLSHYFPLNNSDDTEELKNMARYFYFSGMKVAREGIIAWLRSLTK
jgi:hypothetical protein